MKKTHKAKDTRSLVVMSDLQITQYTTQLSTAHKALELAAVIPGAAVDVMDVLMELALIRGDAASEIERRTKALGLDP